MINPFCGLLVIFCGFISHLIGRETINIPEVFSGVHGFTGKTVKLRDALDVAIDKEHLMNRIRDANVACTKLSHLHSAET